jgi:hypothetical protein
MIKIRPPQCLSTDRRWHRKMGTHGHYTSRIRSQAFQDHVCRIQIYPFCLNTHMANRLLWFSFLVRRNNERCFCVIPLKEERALHCVKAKQIIYSFTEERQTVADVFVRPIPLQRTKNLYIYIYIYIWKWNSFNFYLRKKERRQIFLWVSFFYKE